MEDLGLDVTAGLNVAVVGGGWAGCAAAAELARLGHQVTLLEAGAELGGRARRLVLELDGERHVLDNGQHLLIGAYTATPASEWLQQLGQTSRLVERIWRPLTLAALNTPLAEASAQVLATVLRDSLGASASAAEMWLPRANLSAAMPDAVERYLVARGGAVRRNSRVDLARGSERGWTLAIRSGGDHASLDVQGVVYAAPAAQLQRVFGLHADAMRPQLRMIDRFRYQPITTVYLKYARQTVARMPGLFNALVEDAPRRHHGQWVFNRGALDADNAGVLALVISTGGTHEEPTLDALCEAAARQMTELYGLPAPRAARAIIERRATLACIPDLERPSSVTGLARLSLAGDWTASEYPCTLESAVRSGLSAARSIGAVPAG